jgi:hypothetical protein
MQALPLSNAVDLGALSVQQLEHTVRRATRLSQNLQSETPRPTFTRNFRIESQPWTRIFCIPGAYLAVEHTGGSICCWDILTATRVAKPEIPDLHVLWDPYMELKGKVLIGAYIGCVVRILTIHELTLGRLRGPGPITNLTAVAIDYHDRLDVSISHVLSPDLDGVADRIGMSPTFMNSSVMGWCETLQMGTWSMKTDDAIQIKSLMSSCSVRESVHSSITY